MRFCTGVNTKICKLEFDVSSIRVKHISVKTRNRVFLAPFKIDVNKNGRNDADDDLKILNQKCNIYQKQITNIFG